MKNRGLCKLIVATLTIMFCFFACKTNNGSNVKQIGSDMSPKLGEGQHYLYLVRGSESVKNVIRKVCVNQLQQDGVETAYVNYEASCGDAGKMPFEAFNFNVTKMFEEKNNTTFEDWENWQDLITKLRSDQKRYNITSNGQAFPQYRKFVVFFDPVIDDFMKTNVVPFAPDLLANKSFIICKRTDNSAKQRKIEVIQTNGEMINGVKTVCKTMLTSEDGTQQRIGWSGAGGTHACNNAAFKHVVSITRNDEYACE